MRGLDTNIVVRYLSQDDAEQWAKVSDYLEEINALGETCLINNIVLCETIWVLKAAYKLSRAELADTVEQLLRTDLFEFENRRVVWDALEQFRKGKADFPDYLISQINQNSGCVETVSFDKKLSSSDGLRLL